MAITTALCTSFKVELLTATHNFTASTGHAFKIGLFDQASAIVDTYGAATTNYSDVTGGGADDELPNGSGYTTGGVALTNVTPTSSGTTALTDWSNDPNWTTATFTSNGCFIYNTSATNKMIAVFQFSGGDKTVTGGTFTIQFPTADASNAIIRLT